MRHFLAILFCSALVANAATLTDTNYDVVGARLNTPVIFTPLALPAALTNGLAAGPAKTIQPTNGVYVTSLLEGAYTVKVTPWPAFTIIVPSGSGTYITHAIATNLTNAVYYPAANGENITNLTILKSNALGKVIATTNASGIPALEWYNSSGTKTAWIVADGTAHFASISTSAGSSNYLGGMLCATNIVISNAVGMISITTSNENPAIEFFDTSNGLKDGYILASGADALFGGIGANNNISATGQLSGGTLTVANSQFTVNESGILVAPQLGLTAILPENALTNHFFITSSGTPYFNSNGIPQALSLIAP